MIPLCSDIMELCRLPSKGGIISPCPPKDTDAGLADIDIGIAVAGIAPSETVVSGNKGHSSHSSINTVVKMTAATVLIVPSLTASKLRASVTTIYIAPEVPSMPSRVISSPLASGCAIPFVTSLITEASLELTFPNTDT